MGIGNGDDLRPQRKRKPRRLNRVRRFTALAYRDYRGFVIYDGVLIAELTRRFALGGNARKALDIPLAD